MNAVAASPSLENLLTNQRHAFRQQPYPSAAERRDNLKRLERAILDNQDEIATALDRDFGGRCRHEVLFSEIFVSLHAIRHARKHVKEWMARRRRPLDWQMQPAKAWVMPQPVGVVGIISPWNYPVYMSMGPLCGALAAGNRVMLKLSELTPLTSELLAGVIARTFTPDHVTVVNGDAVVGQAFSALPFDHLLFTGSTAVGREVMRAAASNLTPVTLELGGKSPAILAPDANVESAAADISYGKLINAGQTCVAPDYALVHKDSHQRFVHGIQEHVESYWPDAARNAEYTSIINERHLARLRAYVEEAATSGSEVIEIGPPPESGTRRMQPTLIVNPSDDLRVMREEIFGPVLPVRTYSTLDEAIEYVNDHPRPLALYLFTKSGRTTDDVLKRTISGGACVNDTLIYVAAQDLPFGGIGPSGSGHYHGGEGFDTFSKLKPVFRRRWPGLGRTLRPPYGRLHAFLKRVLIG